MGRRSCSRKGIRRSIDPRGEVPHGYRPARTLRWQHRAYRASRFQWSLPSGWSSLQPCCRLRQCVLRWCFRCQHLGQGHPLRERSLDGQGVPRKGCPRRTIACCRSSRSFRLLWPQLGGFLARSLPHRYRHVPDYQGSPGCRCPGYCQALHWQRAGNSAQSKYVSPSATERERKLC